MSSSKLHWWQLGSLVAAVISQAGCNSESTPAPVAITPPPKIELQLEAKAASIGRGAVLLSIIGTSAQPVEILTISKVAVDACEDAEGNEMSAVVQDRKWRQMPEGLPQAAYDSAGLQPGQVQLGVVLRTGVEGTIGHVEGTFEVQAGDVREELVAIRSNSDTTTEAQNIASASIELLAVATSEVELQLAGAVVNQIKETRLVSGGETHRLVGESRSRSPTNPETNSVTRRWSVKGSLAADAAIEVWVDSDTSPSWILPVRESSEKDFSNESIDLKGRLVIAKMIEVTARGPQNKLLDVKFADNQGRLSGGTSTRVVSGSDYKFRLKATYVGDEPIDVAARVCENPLKSTVLFSFDDLQIAPSP